MMMVFFFLPPSRGFVRRPAVPGRVCISASRRSRPINASNVATEQALWQNPGVETQQTR